MRSLAPGWKGSFAALACAILFSGCAYSVRRSENPVLHQMGVSRLYVETFINRTFKPGVDITVQSAIERMIRSQAQVRLVKSREEADSILTAEILNARFNASASTTGDRLPPTSIGAQFSNNTVATVYLASLGCVVSLEKLSGPGKSKSESVWKSEFNRSKAFPGSNQLGVYGTTSSLINESEFERALEDLATQIALDVHESMVGVF